MSLFRRCKHNWEIRARKSFDVWEKYVWEPAWDQKGTETTIYYVCSKCQADKNRTVDGEFTLAQVKELFSKP